MHLESKGCTLGYGFLFHTLNCSARILSEASWQPRDTAHRAGCSSTSILKGRGAEETQGGRTLTQKWLPRNKIEETKNKVYNCLTTPGSEGLWEQAQCPDLGCVWRHHVYMWKGRTETGSDVAPEAEQWLSQELRSTQAVWTSSCAELVSRPGLMALGYEDGTQILTLTK